MEKKINRFEDLEVWKKSVCLAVEIYQLIEVGKLKNDFGARDQLRRSVCSISNNIAEGFEYNNTNNFIRFLRYAKGSAGETRNQLYILHQTGYIEKTVYDKLYSELITISQQLGNFIKYLNSFKKTKDDAIK